VFDPVEHSAGVLTAILALNLRIAIYLVTNRERLFRHHRPRYSGDLMSDEPPAEV
jgi:hypothetical protein